MTRRDAALDAVDVGRLVDKGQAQGASMDVDSLPTWPKLLTAPVYLVNLDRRPERFAAAPRELRLAGFADITRFAAVDGADRSVPTGVRDVLRLPPFSDEWRSEPVPAAGQRGCFASPLLLWNHIARGAAPFAWVFEDDIRFVAGWRHLAPIYWIRSRGAWDILHVGSHSWLDLGSAWVARVPVYCTHAYLVTRAGAGKLTAAIRAAPFAYPLDQMIADLRQSDLAAEPGAKFDWLVWHGRLHHQASDAGSAGLVLQDRRNVPSDIAGSW